MAVDQDSVIGNLDFMFGEAESESGQSSSGAGHCQSELRWHPPFLGFVPGGPADVQQARDLAQEVLRGNLVRDRTTATISIPLPAGTSCQAVEEIWSARVYEGLTHVITLEI